MLDPVVLSSSLQDGILTPSDLITCASPTCQDTVANIEISSKKRRSRERRIASRKRRKIERRVQCITDHLHSVWEELSEDLVNQKQDEGTAKVLKILKGRFKKGWVQ